MRRDAGLERTGGGGASLRTLPRVKTAYCFMSKKKKNCVYCEKTKGNDCTSTFARYAIRRSPIEDHPPKERGVGDVLLRPGRPQPLAPAALLSAHPRHVEHLAPPVLPLLQPAVSSCKQRQQKHTRVMKKWSNAG